MKLVELVVNLSFSLFGFTESDMELLHDAKHRDASLYMCVCE